ncbi:head GIN domain-containing protein [Marinilabilia salmonicolor]|uniref:head GIN domain-containing protein n=1 Tax=Marinilabilia salmonicolor TaxID=989 RepID=UPI00029ACAFB|nr:head GIN domain-containing protein [Marinilabilia salmonicolor]
MKKIFLIWSLLAIVFAGGFNTVAGQEREERRVSGAFDEVSVSSGVDLFLKQGDDYEIIVEGDEDAIDNLVTELKGNRLNVYLKTNFFSWFWNGEVNVYVTMPEVTKLSSSGGADLKSVGELSADRIEINCSGGADAEVSVRAVSVILHSSGGADLSIEGQTEVLHAESSGGADINAKELQAKKVFASASGGADIEVYVTDEIEASASGGADVDYYGSGKEVKISESGGGDVRKH